MSKSKPVVKTNVKKTPAPSKVVTKKPEIKSTVVPPAKKPITVKEPPKSLIKTPDPKPAPPPPKKVPVKTTSKPPVKSNTEIKKVGSPKQVAELFGKPGLVKVKEPTTLDGVNVSKNSTVLFTPVNNTPQKVAVPTTGKIPLAAIAQSMDNYRNLAMPSFPGFRTRQ